MSKKKCLFRPLGLVVLILASFGIAVAANECEDNQQFKLGFIPPGDIKAEVFPLIVTMVDKSDTLTLERSWSNETLTVDKSMVPGNVYWIQSPNFGQVHLHKTPHTLTLQSSMLNCSTSFPLTFVSTPNNIGNNGTEPALPSLVTFEQEWRTYGGGNSDTVATFFENGTIWISHEITLSHPFAGQCGNRVHKTFDNEAMKKGQSWREFLNSMNYFEIEGVAQSWTYNSFPGVCDAGYNSITINDQFPSEAEDSIQVQRLVDNFSCSGSRTAYTPTGAVDNFSSKIGGIVCKVLGFDPTSSSSQCHLGNLSQPFNACTPETRSVSNSSPSGEVTAVTDNSTSKNRDWRVYLIFGIILAAVLLLALSVLAVVIKKEIIPRITKTRTVSPVNLFLESEDKIFTVGDMEEGEGDQEQKL